MENSTKIFFQKSKIDLPWYTTSPPSDYPEEIKSISQRDYCNPNVYYQSQEMETTMRMIYLYTLECYSSMKK